MSRRVVITGMGTTSCLGNNVEKLWENLLNSEIGYQKTTEGLLVNFPGGKVEGITYDDNMTKATKHTLVAFNEAVKDLDYTMHDKSKVGVILGLTCIVHQHKINSKII